jgi:hypothetical protein
MPNHPGHPALASSQELITGPGRISSALDAISVQTVTSSGYIRPRDGRYIIVQPSESITLTLPDPDSDPAFQNIRIVLKRTTGGLSTVTVVAGGTSTIDGASSFTLDAQYDCEVLFSSSTTGQWHRMRKAPNLLAPDYLDFGDWIVGTDDSNPAPTATSDQYVAPDGTTTADKIEWDNSTELADESWAEPGAASIEAGDTAEYSFYIDSEVGDGVKTVLEVGDSSVPQITEQATVAFSNVFAEDHLIGTAYETRSGWEIYDGGSPSTWSDAADPNGGTTAWTQTGVGSRLNCYIQTGTTGFIPTGREATFEIWIYQPDFDQTINYEARATGSTTTDWTRVRINAAGEIASFAAASTGPTYTQANSIRLTDEGGGWFRLKQRVADYSGTATTRFWWLIEGNSTEKTYWSPSFRYGNHITGQQLLTVDDGVENLLTTDAGASADYTDFGNYAPGGGVPVITTSAIAAPDGTLTATHITNTAQLTAMVSTPSDGNWLDDASWTVRMYFYYPSMLYGQLYRTYIRSEAAGGSTALEQSWVQIKTTGASPSIAAYSGTTSGSEQYSQEKNLELKAVGDTGWYRLDLSINAANSPASAEIVYVPLLGNSSLAEFVFWNPTLRYGDWVSRGKNRQGTPLIDWAITAGASKAYSATAAPDGTVVRP